MLTRLHRRVLLLVAAVFMIALPTIALANTATFGQLVFKYQSDGTTLITIKQPAQQVLMYATLSSAQTTTMRTIYGTPTAASGGASTTSVDNTVTLPSCEANLGDLTD